MHRVHAEQEMPAIRLHLTLIGYWLLQATTIHASINVAIDHQTGKSDCTPSPSTVASKQTRNEMSSGTILLL